MTQNNIKKANGNRRSGPVSIPENITDSLEKETYQTFENLILSNKPSPQQAAYMLKQVCEKKPPLSEEYKKAEILLNCIEGYPRIHQQKPVHIREVSRRQHCFQGTGKQ